MNFATKLAQTRNYTQTNQNGVDSQEVYNEALLDSINKISPNGLNTNTATAEVAVAPGSVPLGFVGVSFSTDATFVGTILGATIAANTTVNINAEIGATLTEINYTVTAGSVLIIKLARP
jgi:hypothetical protein